jgi:hypothetical protein
MRAMTIAVVVLVGLAAGVSGHQSATGAIAGTVTDASGGVLPGVTIAVTGPSATKGVTNARGEYRFDNLSPGEYRLEATLPGFRPGRATLAVSAGVTTKHDVALRLGLLYIVDYVMPRDGVPGALREADVVAQIRLNRPVGVRVVNDAIIVTDHEATVVSVVKTDQPGIVPGASMRFAQEGAGTWVEDGYRAMGAEKPYGPGDSFVAFLRRNKDSTLTEYRGEAFMWPVKQGFVIPVYSAGASGLRAHMPVDEALAALRKLLTR